MRLQGDVRREEPAMLTIFVDFLIMLHLISPASRGASSRDEYRKALPEEPRKEINEGDDDDIEE